MVAFWISTFAPLFWMTVGIPLALANEPSRTMFGAVLKKEKGQVTDKTKGNISIKENNREKQKAQEIKITKVEKKTTNYTLSE